MSLRSAVSGLAALFCLASCSAPLHGAAKSERIPKVLVYTVSAGYEHEVVHRAGVGALSLVERALVALGERTGEFEAVCSRDAAEFDGARLSTYDLVLFYTTGELPLSKAQRDALFAFVREGKGFAGIHCATDTFYAVPEYGAFVGAYFDGHPWDEKVVVRVEDRDHPAMRHLGASFEIVDEIYQFKAPYDRAGVHVLASLDVQKLDLARAGIHRTDADFAIAWTRSHGTGRVFYTALGHRPEVWKDERFLAHLAGGMRWAMKRDGFAVPAPATPAPKPAEPKKEGLRPERGSPIDPEGLAIDLVAEAREPFGVPASEDGTDAPFADTRAPADVREYADFVAENSGDPKRGYELFRDASRTMCLRCHTVFERGAEIGPDLSDVAARYSRKEIVLSVLDPSRRVADEYRTTSLELDDGTLVSGQVRREAGGEIEIADTNGALRSIRAADVVARSTSAASIMPAGLAKLLSKEEFADLVAYMATLRGAPGK